MSKEELLKYLIAEIDLIMHDKDYRFENANGTWYSRESCRDLTNEEVFEELRTELRQLYDENAQLKQQLETFAHRISDQNEEILGLKQQLHDLPKKIVEYFYDEIRHRAILEDDYCPDHNLERKYGVRKCLLENIRTTILKKYGGEDE